MNLFVRKEVTLNQKIAGSFIMATIVGPSVMFFTHNFVAESKVSEFSLYASLLLTVCSIGILTYLYINEAWKPGPDWYNYSKFKRVLLTPILALVLFGLFWINLAISGPQLFTLVFGSNAVKLDMVVKDREFSKRSCNYRLEPQSINTVFFHYCISEALYNRLPDTQIESELLVKQSALGYIVEDVRLFTNNANK